MKYKQVYDGDLLFDVGSKSTLLGCCDCGLVHLLSKTEDGNVSIVRQDAETAKRRRQLAAEEKQPCKKCHQLIRAPSAVKISIVRNEVVFEHEVCPIPEPAPTRPASEIKPRRGRPPKLKASSDS